MNTQATKPATINYEDIFDASYQRLLGNGSYNVDLIDEFYRLFISKSDVIAQLFSKTNMSAQKTMLHDSLDTLVEFSRTKTISHSLEKLTSIHGKSGKNVPLYLFDIWLDSLMEALFTKDQDFNKTEELSWRLVLSPGITYIKYSMGKPAQIDNNLRK